MKSLLLATVLLVLGIQADANSRPSINLETTVRVSGADVRVPYQLQFAPGDAGQEASLILTAPLAPILPVLRAELDAKRPRDNCASYKPDNWVVGPIESTLSIVHDNLQVQLGADVDMWQCFELFGNDVKNRVSGNMHVTLWAKLRHDEQRAWIEAELASVEIGGDLGELAKAFGERSGALIAAAMTEKLADSTKPELPIPSAMLHMGGRLQQVRWVQSESGPALQAELVGMIPSDGFQILMKLITAGQQ